MAKTILRITTVPIALKILLEGQMKFMKEHGFNVIMVSSDGKERQEVIEQEGCPHVIVPMTRKITPFADLVSLFKMCRVIKKYKPDIVHTHTPKAGLIGMLAAKICGTKIRIHTVAGLPLMVENGVKKKLLKIIEKFTYRCCTNVWPNSKSLLQYITLQRLASPNKVSMIHNGSSNGINIVRYNSKSLEDKKIIQTKETINFNPENIYLLFVGRIVYDKGIYELVLAFKKLLNKHKKLCLVLIGPYEDKLDPLPVEITSEIEFNEQIIHINWAENIEYYMNLSSYFIFPSHREGLPNVLLQAGAMGLPVICGDIPGNIDLIENHKTGLIFKSLDIVSLSQSIDFALNNQNLMAQFASRFQQNVISKYNRNDVQQSILDEYSKLLKQS